MLLLRPLNCRMWGLPTAAQETTVISPTRVYSPPGTLACKSQVEVPVNIIKLSRRASGEESQIDKEQISISTHDFLRCMVLDLCVGIAILYKIYI